MARERGKAILVRLSPGELEAVDAARGGVPREQWVREALAEAVGRAPARGVAPSSVVLDESQFMPVVASERVPPGVVVASAEAPWDGQRCGAHPDALPMVSANGAVAMCSAPGCTAMWAL